MGVNDEQRIANVTRWYGVIFYPAGHFFKFPKLDRCPAFEETARYVHNFLKNWNGG